jgi:hypothetical protein
MEPTTNSSTGPKNWIYLSIIALLAAATIYLFVSKSKTETKNEKISEELFTETNAKQAVQEEYNAALIRLDEMKSDNASMDSLLTIKNSEIEAIKNRIASIVSNKNATDAQLKDARNMINSLNTKLDGFQKQIQALTAANVKLTGEKDQVTKERDAQITEKNSVIAAKGETDEKNKELEKKVDIARVLHASNITLEAVKKQWLTGKEVSTSKAGRAKLLHIKFNLDDNRISESGDKELYIVMYGPDGNAIGSSKFQMNDGTQKLYTTSKTVPYTQGQTSKGIAFDWKPMGEGFAAGDYNVEIFHKGFKIGENKVRLK